MSENNDTPDGPIESDLIREDASFAELITEFVDGLAGRVRQMEDAIRAADFEALRVAAHQLKGSGGGFGYPVISERAALLEQHAKRAAVDECFDAFGELRDICARIVVSTDE